MRSGTRLSLAVLVTALALSCGGGPRTQTTAARPPLPRALAGLFDRLAPPTVSDDGPARLVLRSGPPVPQPGETRMAFPGPQTGATPPAPPAGPEELRVLGMAPNGEDTLVGAVRVTFSEPMVPLAALSDIAATAVPVRITPQIAGKFRWLGTQTVVFEPANGRAPMATEYTVDIPAGTRAVGGAVLERAVQFRFQTPAPRVIGFWPSPGGEGLPLDQIVGLHFNQRVDPRVIAAALRFEPAAPGFALITDPAEIARLETKQPHLATWHEERRVFLRPTAPLAKGTSYTVRLPEGTLAAEGPRPTASGLLWHFRTYGPLRVESAYCSGGTTACRPGQAIYVSLTNHLAPQDLARLVTVTPAVSGLEPVLNRAGLRLNGEFAPATSYHVVVAAALRDTYGQTLSADYATNLRFGDAYPNADVLADRLATIETASPHLLPVGLTNVRGLTARIASVPESKMRDALRAAMQGYGWSDRVDPFVSAGLVASPVGLRVRGARNVAERVGVDLAAAVPAAQTGMALVEVRAPQRDVQMRELRLVQVTDLGLVATLDAYGGYVRVTSLSRGTPVGGVRVQVFGTSATPVAEGTTDGDGTVRLPGEIPGGQIIVSARTAGGDRALLQTSVGSARAMLEGQVLSERDPYRPGDTVHLRVVVREHLDDAAASLVTPSNLALRCSVRDAHYAEKATFEVRLTAYGTAAHDVELPRDASTGQWRVQCSVNARSTQISGAFRVEEYRAPEIAVHVLAPTEVKLRGDAASMTVESDYLFGADAAGLPVRWTVGRERTSYAPPGHADFLFGDHASWGWRSRIQVRAERRYGRARPVYRRDQSEREIVARGEGVLDAQGRLVVPIELDPGEIDDAARFTLEAEVTDTSRQSVAGRASVIAHPGMLYAGLRLARSFASERDPILVDALVTDVPGVVRAGRTVSVRAVEERSRLVPQQVAGDWVFRWETVSREVGKCELQSAAEPVPCRIAPQRPGSYVVEAIVRDDAGHVQTSRASVWIYGAGYVPYGEGTETITLLPEKETVVAGETARLLVRTPFSGGRGILTIERNGIVEARALDLDGSVQAIEVQVPDAYVPSFTVRVALARGRASDAELAAMLENAGPDALQAAAEDVGRPTWGSAAITLKVDDRPKRLEVVVTPEHAVRGPGEHHAVSVDVKDAQGRPTDAEVSVIVVDEAVLQLLAYETPDPVAILHRAAHTTARTEAVHAHIVRRRAMRALAVPRITVSTPDVRGAASPRRRATRGDGDPLGGLDGLLDRPMGGGGRAGGAMVARAAPAPATVEPMRYSRRESAEADATGGEIPDAARGLFATTAFYTASVVTDAAGKARVEFDLPDNLTTFRIMAIAIARDDRSGSGQSTVQVRKPLLLRPALPRFATFGDRFEANVIVHNETGEESEVLVGMRAAGIVVEGDGFVRLRLAAGSSKEVSFPVRVEAGRGKARVQFAASAAHGSDAVELDLPLAEPATAEAFATYGSLTEGAVRLPLRVPTGVVERFGGLEVRLSSTALTGLDEAADYLIDYPYLCAEQHGSRLVAAAALRDILGDGRNAQGVARADRIAADAIAGLAIHQRGDGGFVYWPRMRDTELYVSAWVVFALGEAKRAGHAVPAAMLTRGLSFLEVRVRYPRHDLGEDEAWAAQAFALLVLAEAGRAVPPNVLDRVYAHRADMPVFGQAWLESALRKRAASDPRAAEIWRTIENAAVETAEGAHFAEARVESARLLWHSERRTDAIVLSEMLSRTPDHPLVEKTARALIAARRNGVWANTQENAWALSALVRYFRAREAVVPDFEATAWLGTQVAFSQPFRGRDGTVAEGRVSMAELIAGGDTDLVVAPTGVGRLYYRLGLRYAPTELRLPPAEQGFTVARTYEPIGDATNVRRDEDGVWHVALGADLRVRVTLIVPDDRYDVAVDDPLPAGFEATNMAFDTTATQRLSGERDERRVDFRSFWAMWAFDHRELRDDRTVAFARHAPAGVYELTYLAKATTPGRFVATATHVEEMYAPETFGRAGTDIVVVER